MFFLFWKKSYLTKSTFPMKKWELLNKQSLLFFFFWLCFFKTSSDPDQLHHKIHLKSQIEKAVLWLWKAPIQNWNFSSIFCFFVSLSMCIQEAEWNPARRLFTSEFKSFHDCKTVKLEVRGGMNRQLPLFIFIHIMMLNGNFLSLEVSLWGEIEWNNLLLWFLDGGWERHTLCNEILWNILVPRMYQNYKTSDLRNPERILKNKHFFKYHLQRFIKHICS